MSISNSYGAEGFDGRNRADYKHPGIAVLASTGDHGYQDATAPASYTSVIAVGGTSIVPDGSKRGFSETVWSGAGSGCSARNRNKPPQYQDTEATQCEGDAMADVSGPADPSNGGLSVYWDGRFFQVGGTSESTPMIAAVYALAGFSGSEPGANPWNATRGLYDVSSGSNGSCGPPMCTAGDGWDGPTGLGTPHGIAAFRD